MSTPILSELIRYTDTDVYPFHMPGHKRRLDDFSKNIYEIDVTEIAGMDEMHDPDGIIRESMDYLKSVYRTKETFYLVNGSSGGILAAILASVKKKDEILVARNCHKSVYHAIELCGAIPRFLYPKWKDEFDFYGELSLKKVEKTLRCHPDIKAMVFTSPTYEGVLSDVKGICELCRKYGVLCIVDEAHGAHLPFASKNGGFPASAIECGADLVIQSLHKTLPSLTQTALLHVPEGSRIEMERVRHYLKVFQTSSPSYVFMASMERCVDFMERKGENLIKQYEHRLNRLYECLLDKDGQGLKYFRLYQGENDFGFDKGKLVISTKYTPFSGENLAECLRKEYGIEIEMAAATYVIAMTSLMDEEEGLIRLKDALLAIEDKIEKELLKRNLLIEHKIEMDSLEEKEAKDRKSKEAKEKRIKEQETEYINDILKKGFKIPKAKRKCSVKKAMKSKEEKVALEDCLGRISKDYVFVYPPGIPILTPGEKIGRKIRELLLKYEDLGLNVKGIYDDKKIKVLKKEFEVKKKTETKENL